MAILTGPEFKAYESTANGGTIGSAGTAIVTAASAVTFTDGSNPGSANAVLYAVPLTVIGSAAIVITITGTTTVSGTTTGTATLAALQGIDQATAVTVSGNAGWTAVTSITITGGTAGDCFELLWIPQTVWTEIPFCTSISLPEMIQDEAVAKNFDPADHYKRKRVAGEVSITAKPEGLTTVIGALPGRNAMLKFTRQADGRGSITHTVYATKFRCQAPISIPEEGAVTRTLSGPVSRIIYIG